MALFSYQRHDMLTLRGKGLDYARNRATRHNPVYLHVLISDIVCPGIPAIVKMQEQAHDGFLEVGFSSHLYHNDSRVRLKSVIPICEIETVITPFDLPPLLSSLTHPHIRNACEELTRLASFSAVELGIYGSLALELLTALPYLTPQSDIDICVRASDPSNYAAFYAAAGEIAQTHNVRFDIEAICPDGAGVKLAELMSNQKTILCKGLYGAKLRNLQSLYTI
jgi:phosphoribosyl-dephospho-CoA transferase